MDERHRLGQCFNCDEKYVRGHNRTSKHLFLLELSDEAEDDEEQAEALQISLHALSGIKTGETMQVTTRIAMRYSMHYSTLVPLIASLQKHQLHGCLFH
jgi:hypothetical protein